MSSKSPRGSISGPSSAEVAADFEESLKDLQINNRYEISNLTIIAKENTEHAQAISKTLENHIKSTAPSRKLPSLYVLDSIVKNVGTPYTVYLGRNLFSTFMDAYTLVDGNTRKNMEGMLKTWKEPVPGSIDPRPVFPTDTVRPIENALIKAKTVAIQSQRQQGQPGMAYRGTSTPPQHNGGFQQPPNSQFPMPFGRFGSHQPQSHPQPPQFPLPANPASQEAESLKHEISNLISRDQIASIRSPADDSLKKRLAALEALRHLLSTQTFNPPELQMIRQQVSVLSASAPPPNPSALPTVGPMGPPWNNPSLSYGQYQSPTPTFAPVQRPPPTPLSGPQLSSETINSLQALLKNVPKPSTPQIRAAVPSFQDASHTQLDVIRNKTAGAAVGGTADLLSSLARHGLIKPASSTPVPTPSLPLANNPPSTDATALLLQSLHKIAPPPASKIGTPPQVIAQPVPNTIFPITAATLKVFRPELVAGLYDARPNQCSTCARRFPTTDEGREMKARHLDWHFRTNQRIADPNTNRGHHRNWFLDEMDWIRHVEIDLSTTTANGTTESEAHVVKPVAGPQDQFVQAPAGMTRNVCSICFEEMKSSYSEDLQDWVFNNATTWNGKIVHATCLAEMTKSNPPANGGAGSSALAAALAAATNASRRERSATPDSSLGKRKAEGVLGGSGTRLKTE